MFYCDKCADEPRRQWPKTMFRSVGSCEICGEKAPCSEMPSRELPPLRPVRFQFVLAQAGVPNYDGIVFDREALEDIAKSQPTRFTFDRERGRLEGQFTTNDEDFSIADIEQLKRAMEG